MSRAERIRWAGLALLGLAIAAAVAIAASNLVSREIGLASESIKAGDSLAPALTSRPARPRSERRRARGRGNQQSPAAPASEPEEAVPAPALPREEAGAAPPAGGAEDHGGGGEGGGEAADD